MLQSLLKHLQHLSLWILWSLAVLSLICDLIKVLRRLDKHVQSDQNLLVRVKRRLIKERLLRRKQANRIVQIGRLVSTELLVARVTCQLDLGLHAFVTDVSEDHIYVLEREIRALLQYHINQ